MQEVTVASGTAMPALTVMLAAGLAVACGGLVQSGVGFGVGVVAAPILMLLDPAGMPGAMLVASACLPAMILAREVVHTDWRGVSWALAGRLAGTAAGVWVVAALSTRSLGLIVAGVVLTLIGLTSLRPVIPRNRWTLLGAGVVSGTTGTATSIGGPPVALLYAGESGPRVRATMSLYLTAGNLLALGALAASGHLPAGTVLTGLLLIPCATAGFAAASGLRRFLDRGHTRIAVLLVAGTSAIILIGHSLLG